MKLKVTVKLKGPDQEWSVGSPGQLDQNRHCWVKIDKGIVLLLSFMKCGGVGQYVCDGCLINKTVPAEHFSP